MSVLRWLLGRLAAAALVAWVVATVVFFALRAAGGDPSEAILGGPGSQAGEEAVARVRAEYALDQPLLVQYLLQLARTVTFQLGDSYARRRPVSELVGDQLGGTLALAALGLVLAWVIALVVATAAVRARGPVARRAVGLPGQVVRESFAPLFLGAEQVGVGEASERFCRQLSVPVYHMSRDPAQAERMRTWFTDPRSKVDVWPNAGHWIMQDRPDDVNAALTAWIDAL